MLRYPIHLFLGFGLTGMLPAQDAPASGEAIYSEHCASCHGKNGEGVPEDEPELLDAEQSQRVAEYIFGAFYSAEARAKNTPTPKPAQDGGHLERFRYSVSELYGHCGSSSRPFDVSLAVWATHEGHGFKTEVHS